MKNKSQGKIYQITWSPVSHDTNFIRILFRDYQQLKNLRNAGLIQVKPVTLTPVVDPNGGVFNPITPAVFYLN